MWGVLRSDYLRDERWQEGKRSECALWARRFWVGFVFGIVRRGWVWVCG